MSSYKSGSDHSSEPKKTVATPCENSIGEQTVVSPSREVPHWETAPRDRQS